MSVTPPRPSAVHVTLSSPQRRRAELEAFLGGFRSKLPELADALQRAKDFRDDPSPRIKTRMYAAIVEMAYVIVLKPPSGMPAWALASVQKDDRGEPLLKKEEEVAELVHAFFKDKGDGATDVDFLEYVLHHVFSRPNQIQGSENVFIANVLRGAFQRGFKGTSAERFNEQMERVYQVLHRQPPEGSPPYYGRAVPILQSSGTGKSRMTHKLQDFWPTLSVCLRRPTKTGDPSAGYPLADVPFVDYLNNTSFTKKRKELALVAFLAGWFQVALDYLNYECDSMSDVFANWQLDQPERTLLFDQAKCQAVKDLSRFDDEHKGHESLDLAVQEMLLPVIKNLVRELCKLKPVQVKLREKPGSPGIVYIVFDECSLLKEFAADVDVMALRRVVQALDSSDTGQLEFWFLLLDTNSAVSSLLPVKEDEMSSRWFNDLLRPHPAWFMLDFDVLLPGAAPIYQPAEALRLRHLIHYGRPLWMQFENHPDKAIDLARYKLCFSRIPDMGQKAPVLNVLSHRICLDLVPLRSDQSGRELATISVDRHMRILTNVHENNGLISTRAPSEPLLALGAWSALVSTPKSYCEAIETLRTELLHSNAVDRKGSHGELYARLLIVMARDAATDAMRPSAKQPLETVPAPSLKSFLVSLLGSAAVEETLSTDPVFHASLDTMRLSLTHFAVLEHHDLKGTTPEFLWACWKRGVAIQCAHQQHGIDGLIPVYCGDINETFSDERHAVSKMSYVAWQVKFRHDPINTKTHCLHGPSVRQGANGIMTILFELGTAASFGSNGAKAKLHQAWSHCQSLPCRSVPVLGLRGRQYKCLERFKAQDEFDRMLDLEQDWSYLGWSLPFANGWPLPQTSHITPPSRQTVDDVKDDQMEVD